MGRLVLVTPATERLLTVAQAKAHCRCQNDLENDSFTGWIKAAEEYCQSYTNRAVLSGTYRWIGCEFPAFDDEDAPIDLMVSPVTSIISVSYADTDGDTQTLDEDEYQLEPGMIVSRLYPGVDCSWPSTQFGNVSAVTVEFFAGYASADLVPAQFKQAMLLIVGQWFKDRENMERLPNAAADRLLDQVIAERYV